MSEITTENLSKEFFIEGYKDYCRRVGHMPSSAYRLCKYLFVKEDDFNIHFNSLKELQVIIWSGLLVSTIGRLNQSKEYAEYCAREKLLAFYFTLIEELKPDYKMIQCSFETFRWHLFVNFQLSALKESFLLYINALIAQAQETEEISPRPVLQDYYQNIFCLHLIFVLNFWSSDSSDNFANTDAAIEKSTNLLFDLLNRNAGDAAVDFGKFIIQHGFKKK
jgi:hypothetical protein